MIRVLTSKEAQAVDKRAMGDLGVPGSMLMELAGRGAAAEAARLCRENDLDSVQIFCGKGNNGGDGYVCALDLYEKGLKHVEVIAFSVPEAIGGHAREHYGKMKELGIELRHINNAQELKNCLNKKALWVDAVFGTGLQRPVQGEFANILTCLTENMGEAPVLAMDIPSGLDASTGKTLGAVLKADVTVTMGFYKCGLFLNEGRELCGEIRLVTLPYPEEAYDVCENDTLLADPLSTAKLLRSYPVSGHKYSIGQALICAGSREMPGAAALCAAAAQRAGAGMVRVLTAAGAAETVRHGRPELLVTQAHPLRLIKRDLSVFHRLLERSRACCIGPGLGRRRDTGAFVREAVKSSVPMVIDADGLYHLQVEELADRPAATILTPHWGEFLRLSGITQEELSQNTVSYARKFAALSGCILHLKSAVSITALPDGRVYFHTDGTPGMATAGSGDVLAGIMVSLLAQGYSAEDSCILGAALHQKAGKTAAALTGDRSLIASDLIYSLSKAILFMEEKR